MEHAGLGTGEADIAEATGAGRITGEPPEFRFRIVGTRLLNALTARTVSEPCGLAAVEVLRAPNGWGKTVALAEVHRAWTEDAGRPALWMGLSDTRCDRQGVYLQLIRHIAALLPDGSPEPKTLSGGVFGVDGTALRGVLRQLPKPFLICIDNIDQCPDSLHPGFLDELFAATPSGVHILLTTNRTLAYDRTDALMRGELREHLAADLAFDASDVATLLGPRALSMQPDTLLALLRRTEGWAAGLRLAAMLMESSGGEEALIERFAGDVPDLREWFDRKLLSALPPEMRHFLIVASLLPTFVPEQIGRIAGIADVRQHMDAMLARGMFIMLAGHSGERFRFHQLLRDRLRSEARRLLSPEAAAGYYRALAHQALEDGVWEDAIEAARGSGDHDLIAMVAERAAPVLVRDLCRMRYFAEVADRLLDEGVTLGFEARYWHAFALTFYLRHATADRHLRQLRQMADRPDRAHRVEHLCVALAFLRDDMEAAGRHAQQWLDSDEDKDPFDHGWILSILAAHHLTAHRFPQTRDCLWRAAAIAREVGSPHLTGWCELILGASYLYEGNVRRARQIVDENLRRSEEVLGPESDLCDTICAVASKCALETGDRERARALVERGLRSMHKQGNVGSSLCAVETALNFWNGDEADPLFAKLREITPHYAPRLSLMFSCHLIRRLVVLGRLTEAQAQAAEVGLDLEEGQLFHPANTRIPRAQDLAAMTAIELLHARGELSKAKRLAERELVEAVAEGRALRRVRLELILMSIALRQAAPTDASRHLRSALLIAQSRGLSQAFLRHGDEIAALVRQVPLLPGQYPSRESRDFIAGLFDAIGVEEAVPDLSDPPRTEPLTSREKDLMRLVRAGMSNPEICVRLDLSPNTVKWHLKNIFRKMNAPNRTLAALQYTEADSGE